MINIFSKKDKNICIYCTQQDLEINGVSIEYPIQLNKLKRLFGKPNQVVTDEKYTFTKTYVWDSLGLKALESLGSIHSIQCIYSNSKRLKNAPKKLFKGTLFLNNKLFVIEEQKPIEKTYLQGFWNVGKLQLPDDNKAFAVNIWYNKYFKIPENKYKIQPLNEPEINFTDFNFKLCILQILMYERELLLPKFDIYEFIRWYKKRSINTEEERFEPIPEALDYLKKLPIPMRFAGEITEIYQDGGNEIYLNTCLECEGYEDYWNITSIEDLKHFPNLKKVTLCYAKDNIMAELIEMGVEAKWL